MDHPVQDLSNEQVLKLYRQSIGIHVCAGLWVLLSLLQVIGIVMAFKDHVVVGMIVTPVFECIFAVAAYASLTRQPWGRIINIVIFSIILLGIPIGTLIGILGLMANLKAACLFGDSKITHADLVNEKNRRQLK